LTAVATAIAFERRYPSRKHDAPPAPADLAAHNSHECEPPTDHPKHGPLMIDHERTTISTKGNFPTRAGTRFHSNLPHRSSPIPDQ